ncbi:MAG: small ribosomal subunit biogenesis GTPase RsgA [Vulcanimicrobiaceae bacterium]
MRMNATVGARVISVGKNLAWIAFENESALRIATLKRARGKREMLVPGDLVHARPLPDGTAVVDARAPRSATLERREGGRTNTMAANVDRIVIVSSLENPPPRLVLLDQLLAFAELHQLGVLVLFTKPDLAPAQRGEELETRYAALGYTVLTVNAKRGDGIDRLKRELHGHHSLLAGASGVGKSSIFRALGGEAIVGNVSRHGLGRQTTSSARLYRTPEGFLIDSPGVSEFGLGEVPAAELAGAFREMREAAEGCRFNDCGHLQEPGCAVLEAVQRGTIARSRYESYRHILRR